MVDYVLGEKFLAKQISHFIKKDLVKKIEENLIKDYVRPLAMEAVKDVMTNVTSVYDVKDTGRQFTIKISVDDEEAEFHGT